MSEQQGQNVPNPYPPGGFPLSERIQQYAKFIVVVVGSVVTAATESFGGVPDWVTFVSLAVTSIAVWAVPNKQLAH